MVYYDIHMVQYKIEQKGSIQSNCSSHLCDIRERVPRTIHPLNVLFLKQRVDRLSVHASARTAPATSVTYLFDVGNLGRKPLRDLRDHFLYQRLVLHRLAGLHDAVRQVNNTSTQRKRRAYRTMVAWITYLRSSSTVLSTSDDSAFTSALMGWLRLTRIFLDLKSAHTGQQRGTRSDLARTRVQIVLIRLIVDENLGLDEERQHLNQDILADRRGRHEFFQRQRVVVVVLQ